ncbi:MAG: NifU family protein [Firmicutes bacterium]|nr:NifU family protein [Bacillota bacterium]
MAIETKNVTEALDQIRPILQRDGGDIELVDVVDDVVRVRLQGHCAGCPGARMTLTHVVQQILAQACPDLKGVEAVE